MHYPQTCWYDHFLRLGDQSRPRGYWLMPRFVWRNRRWGVCRWWDVRYHGIHRQRRPWGTSIRLLFLARRNDADGRIRMLEIDVVWGRNDQIFLSCIVCGFCVLACWYSFFRKNWKRGREHGKVWKVGESYDYSHNKNLCIHKFLVSMIVWRFGGSYDYILFSTIRGYKSNIKLHWLIFTLFVLNTQLDKLSVDL